MHAICSRDVWCFPESHWLTGLKCPLPPARPARGRWPILPTLSSAGRIEPAKNVGLQDWCVIPGLNSALLIFIFTFYLIPSCPLKLWVLWVKVQLVLFLWVSPRFPNIFRHSWWKIQIHLDQKWTPPTHFSDTAFQWDVSYSPIKSYSPAFPPFPTMLIALTTF